MNFRAIGIARILVKRRNVPMVRKSPLVRFRRCFLMATMSLAACACLEAALGRTITSNFQMAGEPVQLRSQIKLDFLRPGYRLYRAVVGTAGLPLIYWLKPAVVDDKGRV